MEGFSIRRFYSFLCLGKSLTKQEHFSIDSKDYGTKMFLVKCHLVAWRAVHSNDYSCCIGAGMTPRSESFEHLLCTGQHAQRIRQSFVGDMGINTRSTNLRELLYRSWNVKGHNSIAAYVMRILPMNNMWEFWRSRCSSKYEHEQPSIFSFFGYK